MKRIKDQERRIKKKSEKGLRERKLQEERKKINEDERQERR